MGIQQPIVKEKKVYPNDPCPCGSGKKYKKLSGANLKQMGNIKREEMINDRKIILKLVEIKEQFVLMEIFYIKNKLFFYPLFSLRFSSLA